VCRARQVHFFPKYVPLRDASVYSGFSVYTLREEIAAGRLPAYRISTKPGSEMRVKLADIDAMMKPVIPSEVYADRDQPDGTA
jgi:hypothetical protein